MADPQEPQGKVTVPKREVPTVKAGMIVLPSDEVRQLNYTMHPSSPLIPRPAFDEAKEAAVRLTQCLTDEFCDGDIARPPEMNIKRRIGEGMVILDPGKARVKFTVQF